MAVGGQALVEKQADNLHHEIGIDLQVPVQPFQVAVLRHPGEIALATVIQPLEIPLQASIGNPLFGPAEHLKAPLIIHKPSPITHLQGPRLGHIEISLAVTGNLVVNRLVRAHSILRQEKQDHAYQIVEVDIFEGL